MPTVFRLPDIGEGLTEAEIVVWHAEVGDEVRADQPLVTVETDKAQADLPAPVSGVLLHRGAESGVVLAVGEVLAVVGIRGERWEGGPGQPVQPVLAVFDDPPEPVAPPEAAPTVAPTPRPPLVGTLREDAEDLATPPTPTTPSAPDPPAPVAALAAVTASPVRPRALPLVRRDAKRLGVDLAAIEGTGPGGRVTRADLAAARPPHGTEDIPPTAPTPAPTEVEDASVPSSDGVPASSGGTRLRLSATRRAIARNLGASWATIPQVTAFAAFDATRLLATRRALADRHGRPIPLDALLVAAVVPVVASHPEANATLEGDDLVLHDLVDVGVAIDAPGGLVVGTVRDAARLGLLAIAESVLDLATRAGERRLVPSELGGQTFTVSNIGAVGGGHGTPIVPLGTTAILSVGRATPTPVARDGEVVIAPMAPLSFSYDHRVIDGAEGRAILSMLVENLEEPALFLV